MTLFGHTADGRDVHRVTLAAGDLRAEILDYGARLVALRRGGGPNACRSGDSVADYEGPLRYAGPVIAPVINRIANAAAEIGGRLCRFTPNESATSLHSGPEGSHAAIWTLAEASPERARFILDLPDGHGGFPGNRRVEADWRLGDALDLTLTATTDAETLMNPGLHGVFCPGGVTDPGALRLEIPADRYLPVDADTLPTGEIAPVAGTPFDHRTPRAPDPGLDHNFCFGAGFGLRARLTAPDGAAVEIHSDAPGLQAYAGGTGVALEPQLWPDAPRHPAFPSIRLSPGEVFRQRMRIGLFG